MKLDEYNTLTGIEQMRCMVKGFSFCNETFLSHYSIAELNKIYQAWLASPWDFCPDQWTDRQVREALRGIPPNWSNTDEVPIYTKRVAKS